MAGENAQVRIKLVADDATASTLAKVKSGLTDVEKEAKKAGEALTEATKGGAFGMENLKAAAKFAGVNTEGVGKYAAALENPYLLAAAAAAAVGYGIYEAVSFSVDLATEAINVADAMEKQVKALTGVLVLIDAGAHSMKDLKEYAGELHEEFEHVGMALGVSGEKLDDTFRMMVEVGGIGTERARELTEMMARVGKITRGGMESLAHGMAGLERGMVSPRNEIVKLIAATHTLEGNAKSVAHQMKNMSPEKQLELGEKAISRMNETLKKGGTGMLGLDALKTSMGTVKEQFLEGMGLPMLHALLPPLNDVKNFLVKHVDEIQEVGKEIGEYGAKLIDVFTTNVGQTWDAIMENSDAFIQLGKDFVNPILDAVNYLAENNHEMNGLFKEIVEGLAWGAKQIHDAFEFAHKTFGKLTDLMGIKSGLVGEGQEQRNIQKGLMTTASSPYEKDQKKIDEMRQRYVDIAKNFGEDAAQAGESFDALYRDQADKAADQKGVIDQAAADTNVDKLMAAYNSAGKNHNTKMQQYATETLMHSSYLKGALLDAKDIVIDGGLKPFADMLRKVGGLKGEKFAKELEEARKVKIVSPPVTQDFRGSHFNVKQDFRDQDPDRVALVFRRDMMRAALMRGQAVTATGRGGL